MQQMSPSAILTSGCPHKFLSKRLHRFCGEEELVRQVHTLFVRSAQLVVVYELQVRGEVEGVRQEVREVESVSKARRNAHMNMNMWMG